MALTWVGDSNPIAGTTSATADGGAFDTAPVAGDHVQLVVVSKRDTPIPPTPAGWNRQFTGIVGGGAYGSNTGPVRVTVFYQRIPAGGLVVPETTISGGEANAISSSLLAVRTGAAESLDVTFCSGSDTTTDLNLNVTGNAVLPAKAGDIIIALVALAGGPTITSPTLTATGAATGTVNNPYGNLNSNGERLRSSAYRTAVTAGPATAAPVFTGTLSSTTGATGGVVFMRLRALASNAEPATPGTATPGTALNIGQAAGKNHFSVDVAINSTTRELHETSEIVAGYRAEPQFTTPVTNDAAAFWTRADYATTSGSENPRSELRETVPGSDSNFGFDPFPSRGSGFHWIRGRSAATYAPPEKPSIVLCQLHSGSDSDMCVIRTDLISGQVRLIARVNGLSAGIPRLSEDYAWGTFYDWKIEVDVDRNHGRLYYQDMIHPWYVWDLTTMSDTGGPSYFFKAGNYLQANPSNVTDTTEHGSSLLRNLSHWHPGWAAPENYQGWPDVDAGADVAMQVGQTLNRTATATPSTGGAIASREWYLLDGPVAPATLGTDAALSWTPNAAGIYVLRHGATNPAGTNTDDMVVTVSPASVPTGPEPGRALLSHGVI